MSFFKVCPYCGSHLDPNELCDCRAKEGAPASASNAGEGGAEQSLTAVSASIVHKDKEDCQV